VIPTNAGEKQNPEPVPQLDELIIDTGVETGVAAWDGMALTWAATTGEMTRRSRASISSGHPPLAELQVSAFAYLRHDVRCDDTNSSDQQSVLASQGLAATPCRQGG
jgi:hypothetical protein